MQNLIDILRGKKKYSLNCLILYLKNFFRFKSLIIFGNNNTIEIGKKSNLRHCHLTLLGDNCKLIIGKNVSFVGDITIGLPNHNMAKNCTITIGDCTISSGTHLLVLEPDTSIELGEGCLLAYGSKVFASDVHSIINPDGELLNYGKNLHIGKHCWICQDVKIGKNSYISDNSVVSWGSVVKSKFYKENILISGNPAVECKENINWDNLSPYNYLNMKAQDE